MAEVGVRVLFDVLFNPLPGFLIAEDAVTVHADRQYPLERLDV
jgi:hypothetical protein